jgi:endonuclease/exonuclease/phosphatase family metal-dependent hydrolase
MKNAFLLSCLFLASCTGGLEATQALARRESAAVVVPARAAGIDLKTMTYNIRQRDSWSARESYVCGVFAAYELDVFGVQEAYFRQANGISARLPQYAHVGYGREGGTKGEHSQIFYLTTRFDLDANEWGTFWLSDTPGRPSATWGNSYRRICTWARLIEKTTGRGFYVYNAHMDHWVNACNEKGAKLIMQRIQARTYPNDPFIVMGDMNSGESDLATRLFKGTGQVSGEDNPIPLVDTWRVIHPTSKDPRTWSGFESRTDFTGKKIDYIFVTPDTTTVEATIDHTSCTIPGHSKYKTPSDHYAVYARVELVGGSTPPPAEIR